ncbi:CoB--CoM heterodisulfide reductase subunit C [Methanolobus halotolerans]|uniref:CoB--CoM heterodisulfide reductase subunit C n=1 Tax=Methanolobus halotolerans TaxID=2052935 RepID=A0A4E0QB50_9EURY|nr:CoB--CoM heterodisulfide reductase subunit C [Methanolobus halotolerans]TGC09764.1 CoB--CoM heterodisulfide reductase subunit C [Methanolobus halotolerans]
MPTIPQDDAFVLNEVKNACKNIFKCMQCGVCSGSCPSGRHTSLNIRKLVRKAAKTADVLHDEQLWMCTTCYNCQERCPRNIDIVDAVLMIRKVAVHEGIMHSEHRKVSELLLEHGHAVPIDKDNREKRIKLGLNELPETVHKYAEELEEVKILLTSCGFDRLLNRAGKKDAGSEEI